MTFFKQLPWNEARDFFVKLRPELTEIIDSFNPGPEFTMYHARYLYGDQILRKGVLQIPDKNGVKPITDSSFSIELEKDLTYTTGMPVGIVLKNSMELDFSIGDLEVPHNLIPAGAIFALTGALLPTARKDKAQIWNIYAGAKTAFMLPQIGLKLNHKRLVRKYGINKKPVKDITTQWPTFVELNRTASKTPWHVDIIFFGENWFKNHNSLNHKAFLLYLHQLMSASVSLAYMSSPAQYDLMYSELFHKLRSQISLHTLKTVMHLASGVCMSAVGGMGIATDDSELPRSLLQDIYIHDYKLEPYAPVIMVPKVLSAQRPKHAIYYSLRLPTLFDFVHKRNKNDTKIIMLREIQSTLDDILLAIKARYATIDDHPLSLYGAIKDKRFEFFHSEIDPSGKIQPVEYIYKKDAILRKEITRLRKLKPGLKFCATSEFFYGCIRISYQ